MKVKIKKYQREGIRKMEDVFGGRAFLADDMGLGKTMQSLHAAMPYRRKRPIIVICPNSTKWGWEYEVKLHVGLRSLILNGQKPDYRLLRNPPPVIIINWEILQYWVDWLIKLGSNVLIADEAHYCKNPTAKRTKAFRKIAKTVGCLYCLSGTPIENCPAEFFVSLNALRPDLFPRFKPFGMRYCGPKHTQWGVTYKGATRIKELNRILYKEVMIRRTKEEVLKELPPVERVVVPFEIDREAYEDAERDILKWLRKNKSAKAAFTASLNHMARFEHLLQYTAELKLPFVIDWVNNFLESTDRKLAIFGHHRKFTQTIYEKFKNQSVLVIGGIKGKDRQHAIDAFADDPRKRLFVGNIMAAGTGINRLTAASDLAIAELVWVGVKLLQVEGRLHRIGQKHKVTAHYLIAKDTAESALCKAVFRKQENFNRIVDGDDGRQEFDIFKSVVKDLKKMRRT